MYIERRYQTWYFALTVPEALRDAVGRRRIVQSLETRDKSEAQRKAYRLAGEWKAHFKKLEDNGGKALPTRLTDEALGWQEELTQAKAAQDHERGELVTSLIYDRLEALKESRKTTPEQASEFLGIAMGSYIPTAAHLEDWLSELRVAPKTRDMWRLEVNRLAEEFPTTNLVTRANVRAWCMGRIKAGAAMSSVSKTLSACRSYWGHLEARGVSLTEEAPFSNLKLGSKTGEAKANRTASYIAFTPDEVVKLHAAAVAGGDGPLVDLIVMGAYTGARIEELCQIKTEDVDQKRGVIRIQDSKTAAGIREIPIHSQLRGTVLRLTKGSKDSFLIPGSSREGDNKYSIRSNALGKRFGRLKDSLGFQKKRHAFHSLRKTVVTQMEGAGVPEGVAAEIVGHEKDTMTYGLYSAGVPLEVKRMAIENVRYEWTRA